MSNPTPSHLTNTELTEELIRLARSGRETTARLVTHLAGFEARDLHLAAGFPSLFVDRALTLLVADLERKKLGATDRPPPRRPTPVSTRRPPAEMRRAVCRRDGDRCAYVSKDGRRCVERGFLEFHHVIPYAMGGETTVENIQLRCRAHNGYEAGLFYGQGEHWESGGFVREQAAP